MKRPGISWYCSSCKSKLHDYLPIKPIEESLHTLTNEVRNMAKVVSENMEATKAIQTSSTISQDMTSEVKNLAKLVSDTLEVSKANIAPGNTNQDLKNLATRVESELLAAKNFQIKSERSLNAILHRLDESNHTADDVLEFAKCLSFHPNNITKIQRLGQRNMNTDPKSKIRPVKITFSSELNRNEFLRRYNSWSDKLSTFVTPDLSPEAREKEYQMRQNRRALSEANPDNKYQVRNGKILIKTPVNESWSIFNEPDNTKLETTNT